MRINFLLRNPNKKGRTAICTTVTYRGNRIIVFPGESIDTKNWINKDKVNKPKAMSANNALIGRLNDFEQLCRDTHDDLQKVTQGMVPAEVLKNAIYEKMYPPEVAVKNAPVLITDFFKTMVDETRNKKRLGVNGKALTESTISTYETTRNHFINFQAKQRRKYNLNDIDQKLIDSFSDYLNLHLKMAFNGSGKYMKTFRVMMNYARQKKLISMDIIMDSKVTVTKESPDNIYLTEQEIESMMDLNDFETPLYKVVRDYFVIGCKTGLRFSDYSKLANAQFNNGFIYLTQKKTQGKVTIPIHPMVEQILATYPGGLPKCPPNQVFNRYLKDIGKKLPELNIDFEKTVTRSRIAVPKTFKKWELLQTHTARRSFCTNEYLSGMAPMTIMAISGHKSEKSFKAYIKADSLQHAMLMRDNWLIRGKKNDA